MSGLLTDSNALITVFNDEVLTTCRELLKAPRPSYALMNKVIAQQMASILYPTSNTQKSRVGLWQASGSGANQIHQIVDQFCTRPQFKLLQMKQIPFTSEKSSGFDADLWTGMT